MKIGILTLQSGANYGGSLQCIALYKVLQSLGHEVEVINFIPHKTAPLLKRIVYNLTCCRNLKDFKYVLTKRLIGRTNNLSINVQLIDVFNEFRAKWLKCSPLVDEDSIASLNSKYDCIVVGSDQVWSSFLRTPLTYYGEWEPSYKGKFVSYAACASSYKYPFIRNVKLRKLLEAFSSISVRDEVTSKLVKSISNKNALKVLDPTFMYDFSCFNLQESNNQYGKYILVYVLGEQIRGGNESVIKKLIELYGNACKVIAVTNYTENVKYADITIHNASPDQWINLISNAAFFLTDSFHGCVFAIKSQTPFLGYYIEEGRASRLLELKDTFSLGKRIQKGETINMDNSLIIKTDYLHNSVYTKLYTDSAKYLQSI